jgi:hypothetical protein
LVKNQENYKRQLDIALKQEKSLNCIESIDLTNVTNNLSKYQTIQQHSAIISRSQWIIDSADKFINASNCVNTFNEANKSINGLIEKYTKTKQLLDNYNRFSEDLQHQTKMVTVAEKSYDDAVQHKVDILQESHICPLCYSNIDETVVKQIIEKSKKE